MTIQILKSFLLWCFLLNSVMLLLWFLVIAFAISWVFRLHSSLFSITKEAFDTIYYSGMAAYKIAIFMFNFVPYIALLLAGR